MGPGKNEYGDANSNALHIPVYLGPRRLCTYERYFSVKILGKHPERGFHVLGHVLKDTNTCIPCIPYIHG